MPKLNKTIEERIKDNIAINESGCWLFQGKSTTASGHKLMGVNGKAQYVHRTSYEVFVAPIPKGMVIMHSCDNPSCCNPEHLKAGTHKENSQDALRKGRLKPGKDGGKRVGSRDGYCPNMHEINPENSFIDSKGCRGCRLCRAEQQRQWRIRKRAKELNP